MTAGDAQALLLVTRPQEAGRELAQALRAAGCEALWWPAFDLLPAPDPTLLHACWQRLAGYDLVVFVSPAAVQAFAAARPAAARTAWPATTRIAVVGAATRAALWSALPDTRAAQVICPDGDHAADGGSEALVSAIEELAPAPRASLLVRAQSGRERLREWLERRGSRVEEVVAYQRVPHAPEEAAWDALRRALARPRRLAVLYTSSETVAVVAAQFAHAESLRAALDDAIALAVHERIAQALRARGVKDVRSCDLSEKSICAALRSAPRTPPQAPTVDVLL